MKNCYMLQHGWNFIHCMKKPVTTDHIVHDSFHMKPQNRELEKREEVD